MSCIPRSPRGLLEIGRAVSLQVTQSRIARRRPEAEMSRGNLVLFAWGKNMRWRKGTNTWICLRSKCYVVRSQSDDIAGGNTVYFFQKSEANFWKSSTRCWFQILFSPLPREMIQSDEHIFHMTLKKNHLVKYVQRFCFVGPYGEISHLYRSVSRYRT